MAVQYDAESVGEDLNVLGIIVSHTPTGTDRLLLVAVQTWDDGATPAIPTVTYDSVSMNEESTLIFGNSDDERITLFSLVNPTLTADNIIVSVSPEQVEVCLSAVSLTGVDQTTPLGTPVTEQEKTQTSTTFDVSSAVDDLVVDAIAWFDKTQTVGSGQTERAANNNGATQDSTSMSHEDGATTVAMGWTFSPGANLGHIGVNVNAAAAGDPATVPKSVRNRRLTTVRM